MEGMTASRPELTELVRRRAQDRCEYCRMHQALQGATFHVEHITPESKGGTSDLDNLAWSCPACNLHKSDRTAVVDTASGKAVPLFNPRRDPWSDHFAWEGYRAEGKTAIGRATIAALDFNAPRKLLIRQAEEVFELFPPP
jgi:hypothetical protein